MLKLQQLEVSGFKSFVDPVSVRFAGSINAIVGPNGCGKSNLADAITWVLGEQSAKTLRGGSMEDVIFNGSERRRPLGMAEVTLTLQAPGDTRAEDGRIVLGRRVFRTGESRYSLNGRTVRLRDIKDLLMDTGLGIRAYSVIEQGKIDLILSGKPQERRRLLEEAAGVTRYKARRRIAEVKLEESTANLLRLDDILSEVERALRSLKRQASAARSFTRREAEYLELLERVLVARAGHFAHRLAEHRARITSLENRDAGLAAELARDEATLAEARETVERLSAQLGERHQADTELAARIEGRQEFLRGAAQTMQEIGERLARGEALHSRRSEELEVFRSELSRLEAQRQTLQSEVDEAAEAVARDRDELSGADRSLREAEEERRRQHEAVAGTASRLQTLRQRVQQLQVEAEKLRFRRSHAEGELARASSQADAARAAVEEAAGQELEIEGRTTAIGERIQALEEDLQEVLEKEGQRAEEKRTLEDRAVADRQRRLLLDEMERAEADQRADLSERLARAGLPEAVFLGASLRAPAGWEESLDQYLGDLAEAAVVPAELSGPEIARKLAEARQAASILVPGGCAPEPVTDDAILASLGEALGLPEDQATALPPTYLVQTVEDAHRLAVGHPGVAFLSRTGPWASAGLLRTEGASPRPGLLSRSSEIDEIENRSREREERLGKLTEELGELVTRRAHLAARDRQLQEERAQLRQQLAVTRARREDSARRLAGLEKEVSGFGGELEASSTALHRNQEEAERLGTELAGLESDFSQLELAFTSATERLDTSREHRESLRTGAASRQGRLEVVTERLRSHDQQVQRLRREIEQASEAVRAWEEERARQRQRRRELEAGRERSEVELQEALEGRAASQEAVLALQEQLDRRKEAIRGLEARVSQARTARDADRSELEEARVSAATLRQEQAHLGAAFAEQLRRPLPSELPETDEDELVELETELATAKEALDRLGPVNVLAAQEYEEQEERHGFLTEQRADVAASVESLKKTIREINETSSVRFRETFDAVNLSFGEVFSRLFRGGEAEMRLLDEDDPLESGIEIVARPPGKRLQNMMLLSGGEKALTALALLFALFHTKPTPFCILDEVDAPLDDVNTLRFVELLEGMAEKVQFLVITHNKLTMEAASSLYGVTMQERGVSKLVSVELDEVQPDGPAN